MIENTATVEALIDGLHVKGRHELSQHFLGLSDLFPDDEKEIQIELIRREATNYAFVMAELLPQVPRDLQDAYLKTLASFNLLSKTDSPFLAKFFSEQAFLNLLDLYEASQKARQPTVQNG